jgi:riboflavin synthase
MFTGIIETVGEIKSSVARGNYRVLTIRPAIPFKKIELGESVAVDGCCLTVTAFNKNEFSVEASQETIGLTLVGGYRTGDKVNLERALLPTSRLGGHFVNGHIDCVGQIISITRIGESREISVRYSPEFESYLVPKGSVAINGISLTVNEIKGDQFTVNIIPHTFDVTTIGNFKTARKVNLEFDLIGKYISKQINNNNKKPITIEKLIESGW